MTEYDIIEIFREMETDLINSMVRTLKKHLKDEDIEDINWSQWNVEMLKGLDEYRKNNAEIVGRYDERTMNNLETLLKTTYKGEALKQERDILRNIVNGARPKPNKDIKDKLDSIKGKTTKDKVKNVLETNGTFFKVNEDKLNALIRESKKPLKDGFKSILRYQDDVYRQVVFKAQVYANTGVKTIYQATDLATKEFLKRGITNITYKDGKKVNIQSYAEMCIRTSNKKAKLEGEGQIRDDWNEHLVLCSQYGMCSPVCLPYQGRVYVDDVYSSGKPDGKHKLLSEAIEGGLFHPNCRHTISTFFEGINTIPDLLDEKETTEHNKKEAYQRKLERRVREKERLKNGTLDPETKRKYELEWVKSKNELNKFVKSNGDILRRDPWRESSLINTYKPVEDIPELRTGEVESIGDILKKVETPKKSVIERLKDKNIEIEGRFSFEEEANRTYLLEQIDDLSNRYNITNKLTLRSRYSDNDVAAYHEHSRDMTTNRINFNKRIFNNFEFLEAIEEACENQNWSVKSSGKDQLRRKTLTHEFGHLVERELINQNFKLDETNPYFFTEYERVCKDLMKEFKELFNKEIGRELNLRQDLSTYSMTNSKEFFAESFCKMECNEDSDINKVMKLFLKKYNMIKE
jgi:hypothetical protein